MFLHLVTITSLLAFTWPVFWAILLFALYPDIRRWKILLFSAFMSVSVFVTAMWRLWASAVAEAEQMRELYGDNLPRDVVLNQDGYGYVGIVLLIMLGIAMLVGLPIAAWIIGKIRSYRSINR